MPLSQNRLAKLKGCVSYLDWIFETNETLNCWTTELKSSRVPFFAIRTLVAHGRYSHRTCRGAKKIARISGEEQST
jgi:hypothetical protein